MHFNDLIRRWIGQYKLLDEGEGSNGGNGDPAQAGGDGSPQGDDKPIIEIDGKQFTQADILEWKEDHEHKSNWQKEYTQRDQNLAAERQRLSQETPSQARPSNEGTKVTRLTGQMISDALGPDGDNFEGLADLLSQREERIEGAIREKVTTGIKTEQSREQMINGFLARHKEWNEYTAPGGKVDQRLKNMPKGYPPEGAFLEILLEEERASKAELIKQAEEKGFKLGEEKGTRDMHTKREVRTLRGEPPGGGKQTEVPMTQDKKDEAMLNTLAKMRGGKA